MNTFRFWVVFTIGIVTGATVALVSAPQSGGKTRKQIKRRLEDAGDSLQHQAEDAGEYLREQASALSSEAAKTYKRGRHAAEGASAGLADSLQSAVKTAKAKVS